MNENESQMFEEWRRSRKAALHKPWYCEWLNWALIITISLIMAFAAVGAFYIGGGPRDVPFPRTQRTLP